LLFSDLKGLKQTDIEVLQPRTIEDIAATGAERPERRQREHRGVEIMRDFAVVRLAVVGCDRPQNISAVEPDTRQTSVLASEHAEWRTGLQRQNSIDLPASEELAFETFGTAEEGQIVNERRDEAVRDVEIRWAFVAVPNEGIRRLV